MVNKHFCLVVTSSFGTWALTFAENLFTFSS